MYIPRRLNWNFHTIPASSLSIKIAVALLVGEVIVAILGFMYLEQYTFTEALYMAMITISTVGFSEVQPLSDPGRLFTSILILVNIGVFAYALAVFSYYVIQGEIFKKMHLRMIQSEIEKMENHVIICGFGRYGQEVGTHFSKHDVPFVVIDLSDDCIKQIQHSEEKILYLQGDATQDEVLVKAGIHQAKSLIAALPDDSDNVFVVLSARELNQELNIISRATNPKSERKLQKAGASHVVMPEQIGGFYMATLVNQPGAIEFFSFVTDKYQADIGFKEILYEQLPTSCRGQSLAQLNLREETGANVIGYKSPDGRYEINPKPDMVVQPDSSFIILGDNKQLARLKEYLDNYPG